MIVREALTSGPAGLRQLAEDAGVKYQTLRTWASGVNTPSPENIRKLAEGFRRRAARLVEVAGQLEGTIAES